MMCSPFVSHIHSAFQEERARIAREPAPKATDFFRSQGAFGSAGPSLVPVIPLAAASSALMSTALAPGVIPVKGKEPSRLLPWAGANPWTLRDDPIGGGSGGGDNPLCEEDLSAFGNRRDRKADLSDWIDHALDHGEAVVITDVTPASGSQVDAANLTIGAHVSDTSPIVVQVIVDDYLVVYQGNDAYDAQTGQFRLSTPIGYTLCVDENSAYPDDFYIPSGGRQVKVRVTDKGGRSAEVTISLQVFNSRVSQWVAEVDETLASVRAEAGHSESALALADAFAATNRAYLTVHTETQESFAQKAQACSTAIQNWDGI